MANRVPLIAGNWKMNKTNSEAIALVKKLKQLVKDVDVNEREIVVCPAFTALNDVADELKKDKNSNISLGAQNLHFEDAGAFTGEVSALMLKELGCKYVIIGHSERRQLFGETNQSVNKKIFAALKHDLLPIVCVGETLAEREDGSTKQIVEKQINESLARLLSKDGKKLVIAYEPVWAIGTGKNATPEQAQEVHQFIRRLLEKLFDKKTAETIRILYGGSVKPDNISALMQQPDIDGALVGGASLEAESFAKIVKY